MDFANSYAQAMMKNEKEEGVCAESSAKLSADIATFKLQYADPLFRLVMTFAEIFPLGVRFAGPGGSVAQ